MGRYRRATPPRDRRSDRTTHAEAYLAQQAEWRAADLDRVRAYIATLQPLVGLAHWRIEVADEPPEEEGAVAFFHRWPRAWGATLYFSAEHFCQSPEEQRDTVVHELVHASLENLCVAAREGFDGLDQTSRSWAWTRVVHEVELCVDAWAKVIGPHLPLPPGREEG